MYFGSSVCIRKKKYNLYKAYGVGWSLFSVYTRIPVKLNGTILWQYDGQCASPSSIVIVICSITRIQVSMVFSVGVLVKLNACLYSD